MSLRVDLCGRDVGSGRRRGGSRCIDTINLQDYKTNEQHQTSAKVEMRREEVSDKNATLESLSPDFI